MSVDLRELMQERSAAAEVTVGAERVAQVHRRIGRLRRQRLVGTAAAACIAVAAVATGVTLVSGNPEVAPQPAVPNYGFAEYGNGARFVAAGSVDLPQTEVAVTIVPETIDLTFAVRCSEPMWVEVSINDYFLLGGDCDADEVAPGVIFHDPRVTFGDAGVVVGQPTTLIATVKYVNNYTESGRTEGPLPASGTLALAVYQRVPFDEYPLPPRPTALATLTDLPAEARVLTSAPDDPLQHTSLTVSYDPEAQICTQSLTPGYLHILVNGIPVLTREEWGYGAGESAFRLGDIEEGFGFTDPADLPKLDLEPGTPVTITVEPEHVTGAWRLWVKPVG